MNTIFLAASSRFLVILKDSTLHAATLRILIQYSVCSSRIRETQLGLSRLVSRLQRSRSNQVIVRISSDEDLRS